MGPSSLKPVVKRCFLVLSVLGVSVFTQAQAFDYRDSYVPPEIAFADDLRQQVHLNTGRTNINRASFNQLVSLPGFDEELALKVMRTRPLAGFQDFYKMQGVERKRIDQLIRQLQPKVLFK